MLTLPKHRTPHTTCYLRPDTLDNQLHCSLQKNSRVYVSEVSLSRYQASDTYEKFGLEYKRCDILLRDCIRVRSLKDGKKTHQKMLKNGFIIDTYLCNLLISMYAKCGSFEDARKVFNEMPHRDAISWNTIIHGLLKNGFSKEGLEAFRMMGESCIDPTSSTFVALIQTCSGLVGGSELGRQLHGAVIKLGFMFDVYVRNALISMYSKYGAVSEANSVFAGHEKNVVSWNAMIAGYMQNGEPHKALELFLKMHLMGNMGDQYTFASLLSVCVDLQEFRLAELFHAQVVKRGLSSNLVVGNALITVYSKKGNMCNARKVFDTLLIKDVVSWNAMIAGYTQNDDSIEALKLIRELKSTNLKNGYRFNQFTFASILRACANLGLVRQGRETHAQMIKAGLEEDAFLGSALVDMYAKCGSTLGARRAFFNLPSPNLVTWNAMISGYVQNGLYGRAMTSFCRMLHQGMKPNQFTISSVLKACSSFTFRDHGRQIHAHVIKTESRSNVFVESALLDMYFKCMNMEDAIRIFERMPVRNLVSWNTLIAGYVHNGLSEEALNAFCQLREACLVVDHYILASILVACSDLGAVVQGQQVHAITIKTGFESDSWVASSLVDMYSKCGVIEDSCQVFDQTIHRDFVLWTAMIIAYAEHAHCEEALYQFEKMLSANMKPDHITFLGVLSACSQLGQVKKGYQYFSLMQRRYGIKPSVEHYACVVELLGCSGYLDRAERIIKESPFKGATSLWQTFLTACILNGDIERGRNIGEIILKMGANDSTILSILMELFVASGQDKDGAKVKELLKENNLRRDQIQSWIEIKGSVHKFVDENAISPKI